FASFADFQDAVKALPLTFSVAPVPSVRFTTLDGAELAATYGQRPTVDGQPLDYEHWPLFDGPFAQAAAGSGGVEMRHGGETRRLDFPATSVTTQIAPVAQ